MTPSSHGAIIVAEMSEGQVAGEHAPGDRTADGFRVVPCRRRVHGIREGDPVVLLPVEAVVADVTLLRLPTVRRMAAAGMRGCVLVPLSEWTSGNVAGVFADG